MKPGHFGEVALKPRAAPGVLGGKNVNAAYRARKTFPPAVRPAAPDTSLRPHCLLRAAHRQPAESDGAVSWGAAVHWLCAVLLITSRPAVLININSLMQSDVEQLRAAQSAVNSPLAAPTLSESAGFIALLCLHACTVCVNQPAESVRAALTNPRGRVNHFTAAVLLLTCCEPHWDFYLCVCFASVIFDTRLFFTVNSHDLLTPPLVGFFF